MYIEDVTFGHHNVNYGLKFEHYIPMLLHLVTSQNQ